MPRGRFCRSLCAGGAPPEALERSSGNAISLFPPWKTRRRWSCCRNLPPRRRFLALMTRPTGSAPARRGRTASSQPGAAFSRPLPEAGFPPLAKLASESGSRGVTILHTPQQLSAFRKIWPEKKAPDHGGMEARLFHRGARLRRRYRALEITEIHVDEAYDCKRVVAPAALPKPRPGSLKSSPWILPPP